MTPWQWQDKINYEIVMLKSSLERIIALEAAAHGERKSFYGHMHIAHSHIVSCIKEMEKAAKIAYTELIKPEENDA